MTVFGDFDQTFKQQHNLSTAGAAFKPVWIATNNSVRIATTYTTKAIGILQKLSKSSNTGDSVMVRLGAISKAVCDSCVAGDLLGAGAEGLRKLTGVTAKSDTAAAGNVHVLARALDVSTQTGTVIPVLINPFAIHIPQLATAVATNTLTATIP